MAWGPRYPALATAKQRLRKGDLVFIDIGFGIEGYHTDKTQTYVFGKEPVKNIISEHQACVDIQDRLAEQLKPGAIPSAHI